MKTYFIVYDSADGLQFATYVKAKTVKLALFLAGLEFGLNGAEYNDQDICAVRATEVKM